MLIYRSKPTEEIVLKILYILSLSKTELVHNLGFLLESQLLLEEYMAIARRAFDQIQFVCQFLNFP